MESIIEIRAYDMYYDDLNEYLAVPKKIAARKGVAQTYRKRSN